MREQSTDPATECGCGPTQAEWQALTSVAPASALATAQRADRRSLASFVRSSVSRRVALGVGIFGTIGAGVLLSGPAFAATGYPSWDDVEEARANESAKAGQIDRIRTLISNLENDLAQKQADAERLAMEYIAAQEEFEDAAYRATALQEAADSEAEKATAAAQKLGELAAAQYRVGGDDTTLELFFSDSAGAADDLLARLGTMDKLESANRTVYNDAISARDNARNLSDQAQVARDERDRLQVIAEQKMVAAQEAATAAQIALDEQTANLDTLRAQLAALQDTTARTIADYKAGVEAERKAREERERRAREAAEAAARAERERIAREQAAAAAAANNGGGGGGSSSGGGGGGSSSGGGGGGGSSAPAPASGGSGWVRPVSGGVTGYFGNRGAICANGYCTSSGHRGMDFRAGCGTPLYSVGPGTVSFAAYAGTWGNYVKVDHGDGYQSAYAHIMPGGFNVSVGQRVSAGDVVGYVGTTGASTGCHCHFEIYSGGTRVDPLPFMNARGVYL